LGPTQLSDDDKEFHRANILNTPDGKLVGVYASGIRNPVGLAVNPETGEVWTSINERHGQAIALVPDFVTARERGGFTVGRGTTSAAIRSAHAGKHRAEGKVIVPDVLINSQRIAQHDVL
jgi:hypothetical protein